MADLPTVTFNCIPSLANMGLPDPIFRDIENPVMEILEMASAFFQHIMLSIIKMITDFFTGLVEWIENALSTTITLITEFLDYVIPLTPGVTIRDIITLDYDGIKLKIDEAIAAGTWSWTDLPFIAPMIGLASAGIEFAQNIQMFIVSAVKTVWEKLMALWKAFNILLGSATLTPIQDLIEAALTAADFPNPFDPDFFTDLFNLFWDPIKAAIEEFVALPGQAVEAVYAFITETTEMILDFGIFGFTVRDLLGLPEQMTGAHLSIPSYDFAVTIKEAFKAISNWILTLIQVIFGEMLSLLESILGTLLAPVYEILALIKLVIGTLADKIEAFEALLASINFCEEGEDFISFS